MAKASTWLEVAVNGPWPRRLQPLAPRTPDEIVEVGVACARAGAAVVHFHIFDESGEKQIDDAGLYARVIAAIREECDAIVYGTLPFHASSEAAPLTAERRYAAVESLASEGRIEWSIVDPGSVNVSRFDDMAAGRAGFVYLNPEDHIRRGLALAEQYGFHPSYACYEPGFLRQGAALHRRYPGAPQPVYRFMFSDGFSFGFPPRRYALEAWLALLEEAAPGAPWMAAGLAVDIAPLIPVVVSLGGHVRVGLEDAPFGSTRDNLAWVEQAVAGIREAGGEVASPDEVRADLARSRR